MVADNPDIKGLSLKGFLYRLIIKKRRRTRGKLIALNASSANILFLKPFPSEGLGRITIRKARIRNIPLKPLKRNETRGTTEGRL